MFKCLSGLFKLLTKLKPEFTYFQYPESYKTCDVNDIDFLNDEPNGNISISDNQKLSFIESMKSLHTHHEMIGKVVQKGLRVVGKGSWKDRLVGKFLVKTRSSINKNLEKTFRHKTFQLNDFSNCSFQLHTWLQKGFEVNS